MSPPPCLVPAKISPKKRAGESYSLESWSLGGLTKMTLDEFDVTDLLPPRLSVDHISLWERLRNDPVLALVAFVVISSVLSISTFLYTLAGMFFLNYTDKCK